MLIISLHGLGYYVVWLDQGNWTGGLSWNASNTNLLAGTLAWLCGCALWASSITWVRRNFYEVHSFMLQPYTAFCADAARHTSGEAAMASF